MCVKRSLSIHAQTRLLSKYFRLIRHNFANSCSVAARYGAARRDPHGRIVDAGRPCHIGSHSLYLLLVEQEEA